MSRKEMSVVVGQYVAVVPVNPAHSASRQRRHAMTELTAMIRDQDVIVTGAWSWRNVPTAEGPALVACCDAFTTRPLPEVEDDAHALVDATRDLVPLVAALVRQHVLPGVAA